MCWFVRVAYLLINCSFGIIQLSQCMVVHNTKEKGGERMPTNKKQTSSRAASAASKVLRDGRTGQASKTAAGSALAQTPSKKKK